MVNFFLFESSLLLINFLFYLVSYFLFGPLSFLLSFSLFPSVVLELSILLFILLLPRLLLFLFLALSFLNQFLVVIAHFHEFSNKSTLIGMLVFLADLCIVPLLLLLSEQVIPPLFLFVWGHLMVKTSCANVFRWWAISTDSTSW